MIDVCDCQMRVITGFKGDAMMIDLVSGCCSYTCIYMMIYILYIAGGPRT